MKYRKIKHKFNAKPTLNDGIRFDSKLEARYYNKLKVAQTSGDLLFFLRQVPLHLPGNVRYVVDFLEFWKDGEVKFSDVKGIETEAFKIKKKLAENIYPVTLNIVSSV